MKTANRCKGPCHVSTEAGTALQSESELNSSRPLTNSRCHLLVPGALLLPWQEDEIREAEVSPPPASVITDVVSFSRVLAAGTSDTPGWQGCSPWLFLEKHPAPPTLASASCWCPTMGVGVSVCPSGVTPHPAGSLAAWAPGFLDPLLKTQLLQLPSPTPSCIGPSPSLQSCRCVHQPVLLSLLCPALCQPSSLSSSSFTHERAIHLRPGPSLMPEQSFRWLASPAPSQPPQRE